MILHNFKVPLSKKQADEFRKAWDEHGKAGALMFCQVGLNWGPFTVKNVDLHCVILDAKTRNAIDTVLENVHRSETTNEKGTE